MSKTQTIPENVKNAIEELRSLQYEFESINHRMGTNGERGLYHKRKSLLKQKSQKEKEFNQRFLPDYKLIINQNTMLYYYVDIPTTNEKPAQ